MVSFYFPELEFYRNLQMGKKSETGKLGSTKVYKLERDCVSHNMSSKSCQFII